MATAKDIVSEVNEVYGKSIPVFPIEIPLSVRAAETSAVMVMITPVQSHRE